MEFARIAWYVAAWSQDLPIGKSMAASIINDLIVLYRKQDSSPVALEDRCVHRQAPLSRGRCEGNALRCMYRGLLFDETRKVIAIPGQDMIPHQAKVAITPWSNAVAGSGSGWAMPIRPTST